MLRTFQLYSYGTIALFAVGLFFWVLYMFYKTRKKSGLGMRLIHIRVAKNEEKERQDFKKEINYSEQLFSALRSLDDPFVFEVSVSEFGEDINFYLAVTRKHADFAMRQIQGVFPDSQVEEVSDYNIFEPESKVAVATLALDKSFIIPLRTYQEAEGDLFAPILSSLSKLATRGEGAAIQMVVSRASDTLTGAVHDVMGRLKKGEKLKDILSRNILKEFVKRGFGKGKEKDEERPTPPIVDDEAIKTLQTKISKPLFSVNIRVIAGASTLERAESILHSLTGAFGQFSSPLRNGVRFLKPKNPKSFVIDYSFRQFDPRKTVTLNSEELASMFHLPTSTTEIPRVKWMKTREAPPPLNLPSEGVTIGESVFRGDRRPVRMRDDDRRRHLYLIGQTGTGKSFFMLNMAIQDIEAGKGVCVIDPHGELIDDILGRVPKNRIDDVIVFDPGDIDRPLGLNMLECDPRRPEEKTFIVNEIQSIFNRLFLAESMGPQFEQYMRNTLLLLMEDAENEPATLTEVPRVFIDNEYRERKLARIKNPMVIDFWNKMAVKTTGEQSLANFAPYITSKFGNFTSNDYIRPIIGQVKSAFNFRDVMDDGKILLVNLAKGKIGDINAGLLGMIITGRILMAALSRTDIVDKDARRDFYFYIDEFQNFTTDSIAVILAEARKYRLNLILAHQFISQLTDPIKNAVFGNVGSTVAFRVGNPDEETLVKIFGPEFTQRDLLNIDNQNSLAKLLIDGQPAKAFNIKSLKVEKGSGEVRDKLKELSRLTYGKNRAEVEAEIYERLRG